MSLRNRQWILRQRPHGLIQDGDLELVESLVPELKDGEVLVRTIYLSIDPTNRTWMNDSEGYLPPVGLGDVMRGLTLGVPSIATVTGEGGSGGAIAIAAASRVLMLEHSIYSVISPEGAASILWRDSTRARDAATNMRITAKDLLEMKIIDGIVPEPLGGAHRDRPAAYAATGEQIGRAMDELVASGVDFREHRREKFLQIGRSL